MLLVSPGSYKTKARNILAAAQNVASRGGQVPTSHEGLVALEGVGPKIANLIRSVAYGYESAGIVVDTHVHRVAALLGWVEARAAASGPEAVRVSLETWVAQRERVAFTLAVVGFGQHSRGRAGWGAAFIDHARQLSIESETHRHKESQSASHAGESAGIDAIPPPEQAQVKERTAAHAAGVADGDDTDDGNGCSALAHVEDVVALAESMVSRMDARQTKRADKPDM